VLCSKHETRYCADMPEIGSHFIADALKKRDGRTREARLQTSPATRPRPAPWTVT
jgi:hypothetical protein